MSKLLLEILEISSFLIFWASIYRTNNEIGNYSFQQTILYYITVPLIGFITSVDISSDLGEKIKSGLLSNELLQPYNIWLSSLSKSIADKINNLVIVSPAYIAVIGYILLSSNIHLFSLNNLLICLIMCIFAYTLHFILDLAVSWLSFWIDDIWAFYHAKSILFAVFGGLSFPFELLPSNLRTLFDILPFKFMYYIPSSYLLGKREMSTNLPSDLLELSIWGIILATCAIFLWKKGLIRYGAYGN